MEVGMEWSHHQNFLAIVACMCVEMWLVSGDRPLPYDQDAIRSVEL